MSFNFWHNRIPNPAGNSPSWDDYLTKILKEASEEAKPGTGLPNMDEEPRGAQRGQVINTEGEEDMTNNPEMPTPEQGGNARKDTGGTTDQNDNEQADKGGSAEAPVKQADCGKEMGESNNAGDVTEDHKPAANAEEGEGAVEQLINNDPCYQKGESTNPGKVNGKNKKSETRAIYLTANKLNSNQKVAVVMALTKDQNNPIQYVEAMIGDKIANLTDDEKSFLKSFWTTMYPPEYVEEMLADR